VTEEQKPKPKPKRRRQRKHSVRCCVSGYSTSYAYKHGCKCIVCLDAHKERCYRTLEFGRQRLKKDSPKRCNFPKLKPYTGYQYGCRCNRCKAGNAEAIRLYRERRFGKKGATSGNA
jgi:hypothetical protein